MAISWNTYTRHIYGLYIIIWVRVSCLMYTRFILIVKEMTTLNVTIISYILTCLRSCWGNFGQIIWENSVNWYNLFPVLTNKDMKLFLKTIFLRQLEEQETVLMMEGLKLSSTSEIYIFSERCLTCWFCSCRFHFRNHQARKYLWVIW